MGISQSRIVNSCRSARVLMHKSTQKRVYDHYLKYMILWMITAAAWDTSSSSKSTIVSEI